MSERGWAYVLDGTVIDCCRSAEEFVDVYPWPYDEAIDITEVEPRPGPGWTWDGTAFAPPQEL